ncbi:hypothetical protein Droror1_Dr00005555 [Drosera rotundifolia]
MSHKFQQLLPSLSATRLGHRLDPHSDSTATTILLQVNEIAGLQVKKDGKWILVNPLPNAFVVNIGDIMEVIHCISYIILRFFHVMVFSQHNVRGKVDFSK